MPAQSAGLLPYRFDGGRILEVLVVHPGGPFWAKKDDGAWSVAKGEYEPGQDPQEAANREFAEELGQECPAGPRIDLGELRQPSGKLVRVWAVEGDLDVENVISNEFEMEWPPRSGKMAPWPEVDRGGVGVGGISQAQALEGSGRLRGPARHTAAGDLGE